MAMSLALALGACSESEAPTEKVGVIVHGINNPDDVVEVQVEVSGQGVQTSTVVLGTRNDGPPVSWSGDPIPVPIGTDRKFVVRACNAAGCPAFENVLFLGETIIDVNLGDSAMLLINVTSTERPDEFVNQAPEIKSLVVIAAFEEQADGTLIFKVPTDSEDISLITAARDPDAEPVVLTWSAATRADPPVDESALLGTPDNSVAGQSRNTFTPNKEGQYTITVTATDPHGATSSLGVPVDVGLFAQDKDVEVIQNFAPEVTNITADDATLDVDESTVIRTTVVDADAGDTEFTYEWSTGDDCQGTFDTTDPANPTFTLLANADATVPVAGPCTITVVVRDIDPNTGEVRNADFSQGTGSVVIRAGAASNGFFPVISNHERNITDNSTSNGAALANGLGDDSQEAPENVDCEAGANTTIESRHVADANTGNRFLVLDYNVQANDAAECGNYAAFFYGLMLPETQNVENFSGLSFSARAVAGTPEFKVSLRSDAGCTFVSDPITANAASDPQVLPFDGGLFPSAIGCSLTESNIVSVSFVMDTIHAAQLALDDVRFVSN